MRRPLHFSATLLILGLNFTPLAMADVVPLSSFSVAFGEMFSDLAAPCVTQGGAADRNCSRDLTVRNGPLDTAAEFRVVAQASADTGINYGSYIASANIGIHYEVPFVVTRTVDVAKVGGQYIAVLPELSLKFTYEYGAVAAAADSPGGTGQERAEVGPLTLTLTGSTPWQVSGVGQSGPAAGASFNPISGNGERTITLSMGPSIGEVDTLAEIPLTMNLWNDASAPFVDYGANGSFSQTYTGTIAIETTLFARSQATYGGFITPGDGGEAIACFGAQSGLGDFALDAGGCPVGLNLGWDPVKNGGLKVSAALTQTGIGLEQIGPEQVGPIPEPGTALLMLGGLGTLSAWQLRRVRARAVDSGSGRS